MSKHKEAHTIYPSCPLFLYKTHKHIHSLHPKDLAHIIEVNQVSFSCVSVCLLLQSMRAPCQSTTS